jgi:hypothetical protein
MAKFCGVIGYGSTTKTSPGVFKESIVEKTVCGDLIKNSRRLITSEKINDDISVNDQISIIADPYAKQNFHSIKYVKFLGTAWKVIDVEVQYPRLILTLGGEYNGQQA